MPVSVIFIFLFIWLMVGSLFLACAGMLQIFLAFLGGMALWVGVFQQQYIDMFQISAIFLILCIGADDIFVWSDTWKESAAQPLLRGDLIKRHAWTFHRAASGMLNTTATTVICLLLNMASSIPFFWCFGIFNALVIAVNYCMATTPSPPSPACTVSFGSHGVVFRPSPSFPRSLACTPPTSRATQARYLGQYRHLGQSRAPLGSSRLLSAHFGSSRLLSAHFGSSLLLSAPLGPCGCHP